MQIEATPCDALRRTFPIRSRVAETIRSYGRYGALPPGPVEPSVAQLVQFLYEPMRYVKDCRDAFGPVFTLRLPGIPPLVNFHRPDAVRDIFTGSPEELWAGEANVVLEPIVGQNSLLLLDGDRHLRQRRLLTPPFRGERMKAYGEVMRDVTIAVMDRYAPGMPLRFHDATQAVTLDVILRTVFGVDDGPTMARLRDQLTETIAWGTSPMFMFQPLQVDLGPRSPWGRFRRLAEGTRTVLLEFVRARRASGTIGRDDVLSLLVDSRHESGAPMSDDELIDELVTMLVAGHETTATGLAWVAHRLTMHPDIQEQAAAEVLAAFPDGVVDPHRIDELRYVHAVNQETLRIHPIVPGVGRVAHRDVTIGGVPVPSGTVIAASIALAHSNPEVFPDPDEFRPERFFDRRPTPYEFLPFGGGVRRCIGMSFALYEMDVVLATLLARHRLERGTEHPIRTIRRSVTLAPSDGMPIVLARR